MLGTAHTCLVGAAAARTNNTHIHTHTYTEHIHTHTRYPLSSHSRAHYDPFSKQLPQCSTVQRELSGCFQLCAEKRLMERVRERERKKERGICGQTERFILSFPLSPTPARNWKQPRWFSPSTPQPTYLSPSVSPPSTFHSPPPSTPHHHH